MLHACGVKKWMWQCANCLLIFLALIDVIDWLLHQRSILFLVNLELYASCDPPNTSQSLSDILFEYNSKRKVWPCTWCLPCPYKQLRIDKARKLIDVVYAWVYLGVGVAMYKMFDFFSSCVYATSFQDCTFKVVSALIYAIRQQLYGMLEVFFSALELHVSFTPNKCQRLFMICYCCWNDFPLVMQKQN